MTPVKLFVLIIHYIFYYFKFIIYIFVLVEKRIGNLVEKWIGRKGKGTFLVENGHARWNKYRKKVCRNSIDAHRTVTGCFCARVDLYILRDTQVNGVHRMPLCAPVTSSRERLRVNMCACAVIIIYPRRMEKWACNVYVYILTSVRIYSVAREIN
jgi:hypothetical protein